MLPLAQEKALFTYIPTRKSYTKLLLNLILNNSVETFKQQKTPRVNFDKAYLHCRSVVYDLSSSSSIWIANHFNCLATGGFISSCWFISFAYLRYFMSSFLVGLLLVLFDFDVKWTRTAWFRSFPYIAIVPNFKGMMIFFREITQGCFAINDEENVKRKGRKALHRGVKTLLTNTVPWTVNSSTTKLTYANSFYWM